MANKIESKALSAGEKIASDMGVYIVDVTYKKENNEYYLRYYIDKSGGVGIDDCEEFSVRVEEILDAENFISDAYNLEVSSPGADRKLTKEREFLYYIGREVDVKLYKSRDGVKEFSGILEDFKDKTALIRVDDEIMEIPVDQAVYIRLMFKW